MTCTPEQKIYSDPYNLKRRVAALIDGGEGHALIVAAVEACERRNALQREAEARGSYWGHAEARKVRALDNALTDAWLRLEADAVEAEKS